MTTQVVIYQEQRLLIDDNVEYAGLDARRALNELDDEIVNLLCLRRGMIAEPRTVEVTAKIAEEREYRYGFDGALRERCVSRSERIIEAKPQLKLWHTERRGWYWIETKPVNRQIWAKGRRGTPVCIQITEHDGCVFVSAETDKITNAQLREALAREYPRHIFRIVHRQDDYVYASSHPARGGRDPALPSHGGWAEAWERRR
jgi:hypothetical protein